MTGKPAKDFGKRKSPQPRHEAVPPRKRSNHVALLLMGTMALGGGAYALMPGENCDRPSVSSALPGQPDACAQHGSSSSTSHSYGGGGGGSSSRSNFASTDTSSGGGSGDSSSSSSHTSRGGFGSFMSHFSGGG
jgi:hypothetical protein